MPACTDKKAHRAKTLFVPQFVPARVVVDGNSRYPAVSGNFTDDKRHMFSTLSSSLRSPGANLGLLRSLLIYYGMPWRRRSLARFYSDLIPEGALVFDIGAHVGSRTKSLLANGARCVAIEPQPAFARLLQRLFANNERVTLVCDAVGREPGEAKLHVSSRHPTVSTLSADWVSRVGTTAGFEAVNWDQQVTVSVTTLDALISEHGLPAFCKIDVEGMEAEILAGLNVAIPIVAVEYIPATIDIALACIERLEELGNYQYNLSPGESHTMHFHEWIDACDMVTELQRIAACDVKSGDLYARHVSSTSPVKPKSVSSTIT